MKRNSPSWGNRAGCHRNGDILSNLCTLNAHLDCSTPQCFPLGCKSSFCLALPSCRILCLPHAAVSTPAAEEAAALWATDSTLDPQFVKQADFKAPSPPPQVPSRKGCFKWGRQMLRHISSSAECPQTKHLPVFFWGGGGLWKNTRTN